MGNTSSIIAPKKSTPQLRSPTYIRSLLNQVEPFLAYVTQSIAIVFKKKNGAKMSCSYNTIFIDDDFVEEVIKDSSKLGLFLAVLIHETLHIFLKHHIR